MKNSLCVIHEAATLLARDASVRAILLDPEQRRVSFACMPNCDQAKKQAEIEQLLKPFQPDETPACAATPWHIDCQLCARGRSQPLPEGIRLVTLPGSGILLEKSGCTTASRLWKWRQLPWLQVRPIVVPEDHEHGWKEPLALAVICGGCAAAGFGLEHYGRMPVYLHLTLYAVAYLAGAWHAAEETWELLRKRILDIHFLMLCVAAGAASIGHWWEGAALLFLFSLSGALEHFTLQRTERAIHSLFKAAPKQATLLDEQGEEKLVAVEDLAPGQHLIVRPGEQFPVDAEILQGNSAADESNLTGESLPIDKGPGDRAMAGTLNLWGRLDCRVLRPATESSLSKIIRLIKEAQESKAPSQRFTDNFGTRYTYAILTISILMYFIWWGVSGMEPRAAFYRTMTLLVVASPCALVLSIPSAILAGIAAGARRGILFRGGAAIEKLAEVRRVALDKTGTITTGHLEVTEIRSVPPGREHDVLARAAALALNSTHPVSQALVRYARLHQLELPGVNGFRSLTGQGVRAELDDRTAHLGRRELMGPAAWLDQVPPPPPGISEVLFSDNTLHGQFLLEDDIRTSSKPLLDKLRRRGLKPTMLSGDRTEAVEKVSRQVGLQDYESGLSPEEKVQRIKAWSASGEKTAMVGDGVNDAPSLAAAHVGVAMGVRGSDAALEQADVVLMKDRLDRFYIAYELSHRARQVIRQNLAVSLGSVIILVTAAFFGAIPLTVGVVGHEGSTVVVVLNSLRLLFMRFDEDQGAEG